ncbi:hypothetical protein ASC75_23680 [Aminobacter sp. DSM 101952]|nr:hypothetical protein ASC75_23680 [Aminobacter sp. DSM 101952]
MYLVQILLPSADNSGVRFPHKQFEQLKRELADEFGGVTAFIQNPAEGLWREAAGESHDEVVLFEVMTHAIDVEVWKRRRTDLEGRFRQDQVVIRHLSIGVI